MQSGRPLPPRSRASRAAWFLARFLRGFPAGCGAVVAAEVAAAVAAVAEPAGLVRASPLAVTRSLPVGLSDCV